MLTESSSALSIEQTGADCIVTIRGVSRKVKDCNAIILANTMFNKPGETYTEHEMWAFGFARK